jgi:hypothetical protein
MGLFRGSTQSLMEGGYDADEFRETEYPMLKGESVFLLFRSGVIMA